MRARPTAVGLLVLACVAACSSAPSPSLTPLPSASASLGETGNLPPPGCETIDLRSPNGERVVLDGIWVEVSDPAQPMTWFMRTEGDCVWGAGSIEVVPPEGSLDVRPDHVQSLSGHIGDDYLITGEIVNLAPLPQQAPGNPPRYSPLQMSIGFDDAGAITLREIREPNVTGPRCPDPVGYCPAPLVLQPIDP